MKRILVLGLVLALLAIPAVPAAVFAADTDTEVVEGTVVAATIDVVAPTFAGFTNFVFGENKIASATDGSVTVTNNSQNPSGWTVTAKDLTNGGFMTKGGGIVLTTPLYISSTSNAGPWATADVGKSWSSTSILPTWLSQTIANADPAGAYTITLTYTGTIQF